MPSNNTQFKVIPPHVRSYNTDNNIYEIRVTCPFQEDEMLLHSLTVNVQHSSGHRTNDTVYSRTMHRAFVNVLNLKSVYSTKIEIVLIEGHNKIWSEIYSAALDLLQELQQTYNVELILKRTARLYKLITTPQCPKLNAFMVVDAEKQIYAFTKLCSTPVEPVTLKALIYETLNESNN